MKILKSATLLIGFFALLMSCSSQKMSETSIVHSKWVLDSIDFDITSAEESPYFIIGDSSKLSGYSGCNNFFGEYNISEDSLDMNITGSTMKLCQDGGLEARMMQLFDQVVFFEQPSSDAVLLMDANRDVLAKFKKGDINEKN